MKADELNALMESGEKLLEIVQGDFNDLRTDLRNAGSALAALDKKVSTLRDATEMDDFHAAANAVLDLEEALAEITVCKLAFTLTSYMIGRQCYLSAGGDIDDS